MVIVFLRAPRFSGASAGSSVVGGRLYSFLWICCMDLVEAIAVFACLVVFCRGSCGWWGARSALGFGCGVPFVPPGRVFRVMFWEIAMACVNWLLID